MTYDLAEHRERQNRRIRSNWKDDLKWIRAEAALQDAWKEIERLTEHLSPTT